MQYDEDFSEDRIAFERDRLQKGLAEYGEVRGSIQEALSKRIEKLDGNLLDIADTVEDDYTPQNPVFDAFHFVGQNAPRLWLPAMREKAVQNLDSKKERWGSVAMVDSPIAPIGKECLDGLNRLDFIYNRADTMLVDDGGLHFVKTRTDDEFDEKQGSEEDSSE